MNSTTWRWLPAVAAICLLAGCGGGGGYRGGSNGGGGGGGGTVTYAVGGTVSGLKSTLVLRNNGQNDLPVATNGAFAFTTRIANGQPYAVTIQQQPANPAQQCTIANGSGTVGTTDVANVAVTCVDLPAAELQVDAGVHSAKLDWTTPTGVTSFNIYMSSARNCDVANFASCPDGARITNATPPRTIDGLRNGQAYFFRIETVYGNGSKGLSNEAGARPNAIAFNGSVKATAAAADGTVYLGGSFTQAGVTTGSALPFDATTGRIAVADFPIVAGGVEAIAADGAGGWYIGGSFRSIGGVPRNNLAHVLANGSVDPAFDPNVDGVVFALVVNAGTVYAGGTFGAVGPSDDRKLRTCLAAFSSTGQVSDQWSPVLDCMSVRTLASGSDGGTLYAGGQFSVGTNATNLAAIRADGTIRGDWSFAVEGNGFVIVNKLLVVGDTVYVGGRFSALNSTAGLIARTNLAAIGTNGLVDPDFHPEPDRPVNALAHAGAVLYVGGEFLNIGNGDDRGSRAGLAALSKTGAVQSLHADPDGIVNTLTIAGDTIYVGGSFDALGATERHNMAALNTDGEVLPWSATADSEVRVLAAEQGVVYAGGNFGAVDTIARSHLAALDANGALLPWAPVADSEVIALAIADDTVYVGGGFRHIGETIRNHLAAIGRDGSLAPWDPDANRTVSALIVANDTVYVGGVFSQVHGQGRQRAAAIDRNGDVLPWNPGFDASGAVLALVSRGSTIYLGGVMSLNRQPFNLVAVEAGGIGVIDGNFNPDPNDQVNALAVAGDVLYVGGRFTQVNGNQTRVGLAALDPSGRVLPNFQTNGIDGGNRRVLALKVHGDRLYLGGSFDSVSSEPREDVAAIKLDGQLLNWNPGVRGTVFALEATDSTVYVGGDLPVLAGGARNGFGAVSAGTGELQ